jgi:hypothetical protein
MQCTGTIVNCIIWGNRGTSGAQLFDSSTPDYSGIQGWRIGGAKNINADPSFLRPGDWDDNNTPFDLSDDVWIDGNYHLGRLSPCIDAGNNSLLNPSGFDLDGNLRIAFGGKSLTVDMGAYEYHSAPFDTTEIIPLGSEELHLIWDSQPNDTYVAWPCTDPRAGVWTEEATVSSQGATTSWTDTAAAGEIRLYRIQMQ